MQASVEHRPFWQRPEGPQVVARARRTGRWLVAVAGFVVMLMIGTLYSWGIFTQPLLVAFHWHLTTTTSAYAIANFSLAAVGAVVGGFWQDRVGPRKVALTGMALWGAGNFLTGVGTLSFGAPWLYLTYGVMGGIGAGMAYVTPLAAVTKWFPERRGLVGGLVVGGFGLGTFFYNQWIPRLSGFHEAAAHAGSVIASATGGRFDAANLTVPQMTLSDIDAVMRVFVVSGLVFLLVGLPAAAVLRDPPRGYSAGRSGLVSNECPADGDPPAKILRMPEWRVSSMPSGASSGAV
jgi:OFA family oxalate/formate antiporter-like MFS transporter